MSISRLDAELVRRGLARSRGHATDLIAAGRVDVAGRSRARPATPVDHYTVIDVRTDPWVSRAAAKLDAALEHWPIAVEGRRALDVGASTGGFTQVLLARGAQSVIALDVGHGQLHPSLAGDLRVLNLEGQSIRDLDPSTLAAQDLIVADLSFISLELVFPVVAGLLADGADVVVLIKPQFEVGRDRLGKNGIVGEAAYHREALRNVVDAARRTGLHLCGITRSPLPGRHGNIEYLAWLRGTPSGRMEPAVIDASIAEVVAAPAGASAGVEVRSTR